MHVVKLYYEKIDEFLRAQLGDGCHEWEELPDVEVVPEGIVLW